MKFAPLFASLAAAGLLLAACSDREDGATPPDSTAEGSATGDPATASPSASTTATGTNPPGNGGAQGPAEFEGSRALEHIEHLASVIGPRVSGLPGEDEAVAYIQEQFESFGYDVELYGFAFQLDPFRTSSLTAGGTEYESYAMTGSAGGNVTAETVFVGLADEAGIGGRDLTGKIAVADRGVLRFSDKLANVQAAGAIALVVINNEPEPFVGNLTGDSVIPAVTVSGTDGAALLPLAQAGEEMTLDVPGGSATSSVNVIARPGEDAFCEVIVGGHHDTVPGAPGAHDNGSGTGAVIELARALAVDGLDEGVCFATFGGEESGLNGSRALAQDLAAKGELPAYMVNIDANGVGSRVQLIGTPELTSEALEMAATMGIPADVTELGANYGSDHQSFEAEGVPVIFFTSDSLGNIHTPQDTFDTLDPEVIEDGGDLAYAFLTQLLGTIGAR